MTGSIGLKTVAAEEHSGTVTVTDPVHAIRLADDTLDRCRPRVQ